VLGFDLLSQVEAQPTIAGLSLTYNPSVGWAETCESRSKPNNYETQSTILSLHYNIVRLKGARFEHILTSYLFDKYKFYDPVLAFGFLKHQNEIILQSF